MTSVDAIEPITSDYTDEGWVADLTVDGPAGWAATERLRDLLLHATRRQVWRLRDELPGAGSTDLEDLAQQAAHDALLAVLRRLPSFEGRSRFSTWAFKFGVLQAGTAVRRQAWRHREVELTDEVHLVDRSAAPAAAAEGADLAAALAAAIDNRLTAHQRRVIMALVVEQIPIDVLADRLGSTRNALYKTLHDARCRLRVVLTEAGYLEPSGAHHG